MVIQNIRMIESQQLLDRKYFLHRAKAHGNISQADFDKEMPELEKQIQANVVARLKECELQLKEEMSKIKETVPEDGNMKRATASLIYEFLKEHYTDSDIKGIFRQGYKLMRAK